MAEGDYVMAVIVFIITALISILGIIFGNKYIEKRQKKKNEKVAQIEETSVEK